MQSTVDQLIRDQMSVQFLEVEMSGNHCSIVVVSEQFSDLNQVKRQQLVYSCLTEHISSGAIHAVNIKALSPDQWSESD